MVNESQTMEPTVFKDRKAGLIIFGIIQLLGAGFLGLMTFFVVIGTLATMAMDMPGGQQLTPMMMVAAVVMYGGAMVWFGSMGIGSIMAKRWARALTLTSSSLWLACGIVAMIGICILPDINSHMAASGQIPAEMVPFMKAAMLVAMFIFYILIPGGFVLFYRSWHVKMTCEYKNPTPCWTDACPLPVLAASLAFAFGGACTLLMGCYNWAVPLFGTILTGAYGAALCIIAVGVFFYVAWGVYKMQMSAWWTAVIAVCIWFGSFVLSFTQISMGEYYKAMNFTEQQLELMIAYNTMWQSPLMVTYGVAWIAAIVGYLVYIKKYFTNNNL